MKPGVILVNDVEFIQIREGKTNKVTMKNFKLCAADILPVSSLTIELRKRKV